MNTDQVMNKFGSNHPEVFSKNGILKKLTQFTEKKHLLADSLFNNAEGRTTVSASAITATKLVF